MFAKSLTPQTALALSLALGFPLVLGGCASSSTPRYAPLDEPGVEAALYQRLVAMPLPAQAAEEVMIRRGGSTVQLSMHTSLTPEGRFRAAAVDDLGVTVFQVEAKDGEVDVILKSPRFDATFLRSYLVPDLLAVMAPPPEEECELLRFADQFTVLSWPVSDSRVLFFQEQAPGLNQYMRRRGTQTLSELELSMAPPANPNSPTAHHLQITSDFGAYTASIVIRPEGDG